MRRAVLLAVLLWAQAAQGASRAPVRGQHGMVASSSELASRAGLEILQKGGNAVDAAVAVALALAVTHPSAGNLGGGGFMVVRMADGRSVALDYRETAPRAASRDMYLDPAGNVVDKASTLGYRAAGVPGTIAGLELAHHKYGKLKWAELVEPARRLAAEGFVLSRPLAREIQSHENHFKRYPESYRLWVRSGRPYQEGERFKNPDLAQTLARLQKEGPREFYEGQTARLIAEDMKANGGLITLEDLRAYRPKERELLRGTYRGYEVLTMPPPSSGGATLLQELNILEGYDLGALGYGSAAAEQVIVEAMRRAFADRAVYFGDPDFTPVPAAALVSKGYALKQRASIDPLHATPSAALKPDRSPPVESNHTTHFSVVDAEGNAVSNTYTLNLGYGSCVTVKGAGFLLNDEMDDFTAKVGVPNAFGLLQSEKNAIAPGKRPLSSMTPTLVLKDGKLWLVVGTPGGPTIINSVLQVLLGVIDFGMDLQQAVDAPRLHHQWMPDEVFLEPRSLSPDTQALLTARGQHLSPSTHFMKGVPYAYFGDVEAVMIEPGTGVRLGAADPRGSDSAALGY